MRVGALYDLVFGVAILAFHRTAAGWMGLEPPSDPVFLRLNGVFLLILAGFYLLPGVAPRRYQGVVAVCIVGRFGGFVYLGSVYWGGAPPVYLGLALADLLLSLVHAVLLLRARADASA